MAYRLRLISESGVGSVLRESYRNLADVHAKLDSLEGYADCIVAEVEFWPDRAGRVELVAQAERYGGQWVKLPAPFTSRRK